MKEEIWKEIEDYEGLYQISNLGRVKSLSYGLLTPARDKDGYLQFNLSKDGKQKMHKAHRLVASAFIDNPDSLPEVNHKDEDKENNSAKNLEWCDHHYNCNYSFSKSIIQYTIDGEFVKQWESSREIERQLGYDHCGINKCCRGVYKTSYGFKWQYENGSDKRTPISVYPILASTALLTSFSTR